LQRRSGVRAAAPGAAVRRCEGNVKKGRAGVGSKFRACHRVSHQFNAQSIMQPAASAQPMANGYAASSGHATSFFHQPTQRRLHRVAALAAVTAVTALTPCTAPRSAVATDQPSLPHIAVSHTALFSRFLLFACSAADPAVCRAMCSGRRPWHTLAAVLRSYASESPATAS